MVRSLPGHGGEPVQPVPVGRVRRAAGAIDELLVATVVRVEEHAGARAPSYLLTLDLGGRGSADAVVPTGDFGPERLEGTQVVCRLEADGPVIVGAHSHGKGFVPLRPETEVEPGTLVT